MKANNNIRVKVDYCQKGGVFAMQDKEPTGNYVRHNYLVMSDITPQTETVLCFGITTCRNGRWDNVVPLTSSNDVSSYIDLNKVYVYKVKDFACGHYHGNINDLELLRVLTSVMKMRLGLLAHEKISTIVEKMKEVTVTTQDGVIVTDDPVLEELAEDVEVVEPQTEEVIETTGNEEESSKPEPKKVSERTRNSETLVGIFPFRSSSWTDEQLLLFTHEYECGNYNNCRAHIKSATEAVLLKRYEKAVQELDKRGLLKKGDEKKEQPSQDNKVTEEKVAEAQADEKQPVKTFSQKAKRYSPSFWTREELELFAELYASEEGKSVLKSEFALTTAGLISKNTEVSRRLGKASYNK